MFASKKNRARATLVALLATAVAAACETPLEDRILDIEAEGQALIFLFRDNNLNGLDGADTPLENTRLTVRRLAVPTDTTVIVTDTAGFVFTPSLQVGEYQIELPDELLGDSLVVFGTGTDPFTITRNDTTGVGISVAFPSMSIDSARALPVGKKVWLRGITLHDPGIFGDTTLHVADSVAAIRIVEVLASGNINPGNSVQILGTRQERNGQPVHVYNSAIISGSVPIPRATLLTSGQAANANGGESDAALIEIKNVPITDSLTVPGRGKRLTVNDGSGALEVFVHNSLGFSAVDLRAMAPGLSVDVTGVLVPSTTTANVWVLKPRVRSDLLPALVTPSPSGGT